MYLTLLEYVLVRLFFGAARVVVQAIGLAARLVLWLLGALLRLGGRPMLRELARAVGRLRGYRQLAVRSRTGTATTISSRFPR